MKHPESDPWNAATFEGARAAQTREAASRTTAYERIRWACEMSEAIREHDELARQERNHGLNRSHR